MSAFNSTKPHGIDCEAALIKGSVVWRSAGSGFGRFHISQISHCGFNIGTKFSQHLKHWYQGVDTVFYGLESWTGVLELNLGAKS